MSDTPGNETIKVDELTKLRFDYAWKYFDSASRQRMLFFNYFLIIVGILANGYVLSMKDGWIWIASFICVLGLLVVGAFIFFDVRTRHFVALAEDALEELERRTIFPNGFVLRRDGGTAVQLGFLRREADEAKMREGQSFSYKRVLLKQKYWIRGVEALAGLGFLLALVTMSVHSKSDAGDVESSSTPASNTSVAPTQGARP